LAALLLLVLTAASMQLFGLGDTAAWRPYFVFAGLWFLAFTVPTMLWLKEPDLPQAARTKANPVVEGFRRLGQSFHQLKGYRDLAWLMLASFFYGTAMSVMVAFASKLAQEYGFSQVKLVLFIAVITVSGIVGTL